MKRYVADGKFRENFQLSNNNVSSMYYTEPLVAHALFYFGSMLLPVLPQGKLILSQQWRAPFKLLHRTEFQTSSVCSTVSCRLA